MNREVRVEIVTPAKRHRDRGRWGDKVHGPLGMDPEVLDPKYRNPRPPCSACGRNDSYPYWVGDNEDDVICFRCLLDRRERSDFNLRKRIGLPDDLYYHSRSVEDDESVWSRLLLQAGSWWHPAVADRSWVTLKCLRALEDYPFEAWWDLGDPDRQHDGREPVIEVRGTSPGLWGGVYVDDAVASAAWWVLESFSPEDARSYIGAGLDHPCVAREWLGWLVDTFSQSFPEENLVDWRDGHWQATSNGFALMKRLRCGRVLPMITRGDLYLTATSRGRSLEQWLDAYFEWFTFCEPLPPQKTFPCQRAIWWMRLGISVEEVSAWCEAGFVEPWDVSRWLKAKLDVKEATRWREAGFDSDRADAWRMWDFSLEEALAWDMAAAALKAIGVSMHAIGAAIDERDPMPQRSFWQRFGDRFLWPTRAFERYGRIQT